MSSKNPDLQAAIDSRLNDALAQANFRIAISNQRANARLKLQKNLMYSINGGTFVVSSELISFISALLSHGKEEAVLLDIKLNPIQISDLSEFLDNIMQLYYECTNDFLTEFKSISKNRTTKAIIGDK